MKTRNIIMIVVLALLFVAAGVLVIVGVATHEEAGLLGWCDETYAEEATQACPAPVWNHTPISITAMSDNPHPPMEPEEATRSVVDTINTRLGFELLRYDPDPGHCMEAHSICVRIGEPREDEWMDTAGDARHHFDGPALHLYCDVRTSNTGTSELLLLVLQHEVLHCIGLAHDDFEASIMRRSQTSTPDGEFPPRITDHDRALLRARFGQ